jgi:hypothetical protein
MSVAVRTRFVVTSIAALLAILLASCPKPRYVVYGRVTGTCEGACRHYLACKGSDDETAFRACLSECRLIFSSAETLEAFEKLDCADAIAFVEGSSGRGPGDPPAASQWTRPRRP